MTVVVSIYPHGSLSFRRGDQACSCGAKPWTSPVITACPACRNVTGAPVLRGDDAALIETLRSAEPRNL